MKTPKMSDVNNLRNKTRTPNILQNVDRPLPSPTSSMKLNESGPLSPALSPNTKSFISQKLQTLKQRKLDLDKLLIEKNNLLHQLCREETKLIGSTYSLNDITNIGGIDGGDGNMDRLGINNNNNASLRRHVDTGFKLPENLLNSNEDDINQLLLSKKIQQQISQASLKMANDVTQTKSIRRAHKQNFDIAQQKIQSLNNNLSMLKKCDRDSINANNNMGYAAMNMNSVINGSKLCADSHDLKLKPNLNVSSTSLDNSNGMHERRNSAVSTGSASQYLTGYSQKYRQRCDSYGGHSAHGQSTNVNNNNNNNNNKDNNTADNSMHSPNYYQHQQIPHLHYKSHADKVAYVTKAVANAAAANNNNNNNSNNNNPVSSSSTSSTAMSSPKYGRLRPLTVDTNTNESYYYPPSGNTNHQHRTHFQQFYTQQHSHQHRHSPYTVHRGQITPTTSRNVTIHSQINVNAGNSDDEDDIAGQYATLLTLSDQNELNPSHQEDIDSHQETETHYSEVLGPKQSAPSPLIIDRCQIQPMSKDAADMPAKSKGLGGYWTTNENMERIWCTMDNRFSSLDRKSQKNKQNKKMLRNVNQPTKSTSLGSFNFINKPDELTEANLAAIAHQNEQRRSRDKPWIETALDGPPARKSESISPSLASPSIYYRDRTRLSSHSMHSPSRNAGSISSTSNTLTPLQTSQILNSLSKAFSTSATALPAMDTVVMNQHLKHQQQQPMSPTYYHNTATQTPVHFENQPSALIQSKLNSPDMPSMNTLYHDSVSVMTPTISPLEIQIESPKNVTIVQPAKFQPYKEVSKPFEMSDFYKYSTKFRQKTASASLTHPENCSPKLPPKNITHQMKNPHRHVHSISNVNVVDSNPSAYAMKNLTGSSSEY